jgi:cytochrome c-type biogenesis protein
MPEEATLVTAFVAGILSFISPCVLPLVPGYLSFISGISLEEMRGHGGTAPASATRHVFLASLAFVAGFSLVFVALGATASTLGAFLFRRISLLEKIAGVLLIIFGLHTIGVLRIPWLYREARLETRRPVGMLGAFLVGLAFAFGWTPCIGPILGSIMALAAEEGTLRQGVKLLAVYSLGLGLPFLAAALAIDRFLSAFARIRRHYRTIEVVAGLLMVIVGVLLFTDQFSAISRAMLPYLPTF